MKTVLTAVLAVLGTFVLLPHSADQATTNSAPEAPGYIGEFSGMPRFEVVTIHADRGEIYSGLLDTQTGCTWVYAQGKDKRLWDYRAVETSTGEPLYSVQQNACNGILFHVMGVQQPAPGK
jgi:hypothetical protein